MLYYGVFIPGKTNFEGSVESCPGSVAAVNYNPLMVQTSISGSPISCDEQLLKEDPEYPVDSPDWLVFLEKSKALDLLRQYKEARLREFANLEQAERYVQFGFESVQSMKLFAKVKKSSPSSSSYNNSSGTQSGSTIQNKTSNITAKSSSSNSSSTTSNGNDMPTPSTTGVLSTLSWPAALSLAANPTTDTAAAPAVATSMASAERPPFRAPTKQELVEFRKAIESGDCSRVSHYVWENPRYLISCGDTPTNLKEGYRYNSIHICAQFNQPLIAELLLKVVSDRRFAYLYTGKRANPNMCAALNKNLLDYYLNMPDKGRSETPLHFASKNGHWQVVAVLVSYPECKSLPNKEGQLPKDIICQRARVSDPEVFEKIKLLLTERFYVPVLRAFDQTMPPKIGQPFSSSNPPYTLVQKDEGTEHPFSPNYKIKALAGPMSKDQADKFCRRWKTPPRLGNNMGSNPSSPAIINNVYISPLKPPYSLLSSPMHKSMMMKPQRRRVLFSPNLPEKPLRIVETNDEAAAVTRTHGGENKQGSSNNHHHVANMVNGLNGGDSEHAADKENGNYTKTQQQQQQQHQSNQEEQEQQLNDQDQQEQQSQQSQSGPEQSDAIMNITYEIETNNNDTNAIHSTTSVNINSQTHYEKYGTIAFPYTPSKQQYRDIFSATSLGNDSATINCQFDESITVLNDSYKERHIKNTDFDKGLESIGRQLAKQENINWREYWDFLDDFIDMSHPSGLDTLEQYFAQRIQTIDLLKQPKHYSPLNDLCNALARAGLGDYNRSSNSTPVSAKNNSTTKHHHQIGTSHWAQLCSNFTITTAPPPTPTTTASSIAASTGAEVVVTTTPVPQVNTPYTCVEKSLQVFAKRMTKTIINNINNVVSINDTLLSELKRLKSLISSFKEDVRFYSVDFSKVHSRIGNLVATYIANSNEVMLAIKLKIQSVLRDLLVTRSERREHLECVCAYMLQMLERSSNQLPDNLKTEELCSSAWAVEKSCECQWDGNLSRKTSRRKRTESSLYGQQQHDTKESSKENIEMIKNINSYVTSSFNTGDAAAAMSVVLPIATSTHWQNNHLTSNNMGEGGDNVVNEENIWWDCGTETETETEINCDGDSDDYDGDGDGDDDDDDDCYQTPPERLSPQPLMEDQCYKVYVLGDVPTKRDLDVLNAIANVKIDKERYPCICAWKEALTGFSVQEMDLFPSPLRIRSTELAKKEQRANETPKTCAKDEGGRLKSAFESKILAQIAGRGKRLFSTPKLSSATMNLRTEAVTNAANAANAAIGALKAATTATVTTTPISNNRFGPFKTPLFKMRGLFSQYRQTSNNDCDDDDDDNDIGIGDGHKAEDICEHDTMDSNDLKNDSLLLHN